METVFQLFDSYYVWPLVAFIGYFVVLPFTVARTMKFKRYPKISLIEDDSIIPRVSADFFEQTDEEIAPLNFEPVVVLTSDDVVPNTFFIGKLYQNKAEQVSLLITSIYSTMAELDAEPIQHHYCEFVSYFQEGQCKRVFTSNQKDPGAFAVPEEYQTVRLPQIEDAVELFEYHQKNIKSVNGSSAPHSPYDFSRIENVPSYIQRSFEESFEREVTRGNLTLSETDDEDDSYYHPTFLGGYFLVWQEMWPIKPFRLASFRRTSRKQQDQLDQFS